MGEMPEFSKEFRQAARSYGLTWLHDGFPGVDRDGDKQPHPILGVYVLADYLRQHQRQPRESLVAAISRVANSAVRRMQSVGDALIFSYPADPNNYSRATHSHPSGLTQAYYALTLLRAAKVTAETALEEAAHRCFRSLIIPVEQGGVLRETPWGPAIEELPSEPPSLILNGWLSALVWLWRYGRSAPSSEALELLKASTSAMIEMLPLYDDPANLTSRYGLSGFAYVRLRFPRSSMIERIDGIRVEVPHFSTYEVVSTSGASRWSPYIFADDVQPAQHGHRPTGRSVRANLIFCRSSLTAGNKIIFALEAKTEHHMKLEVQVGEYDPLRAAPARPRWTALDQIPVEPGRMEIAIEVPPSLLDVTVYPTNCKKIIEGRQTNVYHGIHIDRLRTLARALGDSRARDWAQRWTDYAAEWPNHPLYQDCRVAIPDRLRHPESDLEETTGS